MFNNLYKQVHDLIERTKALNSVKQNGFNLGILDDKFKKDKAIVEVAVLNNPFAIQFVSATLEGYKSIAECAVKLDGWVLKLVDSSLKDNKNFVMPLLNQNGLLLQYVSDNLKKDKEIIKTSYKNNPYSFGFVTDVQTIVDIAKLDIQLLKYCSRTLKESRTFFKKVVAHNSRAIEFATDDLRNDKNFAIELMSVDGMMLEFIGKALKDDKDVVKAAVNNNYESFQFASKRLKDTIGFVRDLVKINGFVLKFAGFDSRYDKETMINATLNNVEALDFPKIGGVLGDKDFVRGLVKLNPKSLRYMHNALQQDKTFIKEMLLQDASRIKYLRLDYKKDMELALYIVGKNGLYIQRCHYDFDGCKSVKLATKAVSNNGLALQFLDKRLQSDPIIVRDALLNNLLALRYVTCNGPFRNNLSLIAMLIFQNKLDIGYVKSHIIIGSLYSQQLSPVIKSIPEDTPKYNQFGLKSLLFLNEEQLANKKKFAKILLEKVDENTKAFCDLNLEFK